MTEHLSERAGALRFSVTGAPSGARVLTIAPLSASLPAVECLLAGSPADRDDAHMHGGALHFGVRPFATSIPGHGVFDAAVSMVADAVPADSDVIGLTIRISAASAYPFDELTLPGPVRLARPSTRWHFLAPRAEGEVLPADGADGARSSRVAFWDNGISLPMVALLDGRHAQGGSLFAFAVQGQDEAVDMLAPDAGRGPGMALVHAARMGRWGGDRVWRLVWVQRPGLVALARSVRAELRASGFLLQTLPDKLTAHGVPAALQESIGGTHVWWSLGTVPPAFAADLHRDGLRSVALMGSVTPGSDAARELAAAGHVVAPYFQSTDALPPGSVELREWRGTYPPEGTHDGWPDQLLRARNGHYEPNWLHFPNADGLPVWAAEDHLGIDGAPARRDRMVRDVHFTQGYLRCPRFHGDVAERHLLPLLDRDGYGGVFYDVLTAHHTSECYASGHPCDRAGDVEMRLRALRRVTAGGRFVSSEFGRWWAVDDLHAFEGILTYGEWDANHAVLGDYAFRDEWWDTAFNLQRRVPFFGLVARQCVARTLWWGQGQDRNVESWGAKDALCALFGGNPIFVVDPLHPLAAGSPRWNRFAGTVRAFDVLRAHTWGRAIDAYEVQGKHVGITTFEGGATVRANLGPEPAAGMAPGSWELYDAAGSLLLPAAAGCQSSSRAAPSTSTSQYSPKKIPG